MTTEDNVFASREVIEEAFNNGNYAALNSYFQPDFIEHQFGLHATIEGMQGDIQYLRKAFPDFHLTIEDTAADGDKVWIRSTARGTNRGGFMGPPNNQTFEIAVFDLLKFHNGQIVEHWGTPDRFALLSQLGLLPKK
ncbi:MAG: ester cyclase [Candidatus Promineifilaceae bacterium]